MKQCEKANRSLHGPCQYRMAVAVDANVAKTSNQANFIVASPQLGRSSVCPITYVASLDTASQGKWKTESCLTGSSPATLQKSFVPLLNSRPQMIPTVTKRIETILRMVSFNTARLPQSQCDIAWCSWTSCRWWGWIFCPWNSEIETFWGTAPAH